MTYTTIEISMSSQQGKSGVGMCFGLVNYRPVHWCVTCLAPGSQPSLMNIGVAVPASRVDLAEIGYFMTLAALKLPVNTLKQKTGTLMVEIHLIPVLCIMTGAAVQIHFFMGHVLSDDEVHTQVQYRNYFYYFTHRSYSSPLG
jgi:hypothetical protein